MLTVEINKSHGGYFLSPFYLILILLQTLTSSIETVNFIESFSKLSLSSNLMYTDFFALSEVPFSIAPNPRYLFMSDRHKEALAHLTYGLGSTGGFVLLTGEVGTGKTTVSRKLLDQLSDDTQAAFILNPTLSSQELLATICDELKIRYRKTGATLKTLTDKIQGKLLKNHQEGINTVLLIDEAQHLKPEVLEQLRLLTNLETHTKKLLQVILIGQPELQRLLQRQDLRQLAQRITARYHLLPLNKAEVAQYIRHRLHVAGSAEPLFSKGAIAAIHQLSKGIPRLINLLCDRALLGAFGKGKSQVDRALVIGASQEALGEEYHLQPWYKSNTAKLTLAASLIVTTLFTGFYLGQDRSSQTGAVELNDVTYAQDNSVNKSRGNGSNESYVNNGKSTSQTAQTGQVEKTQSGSSLVTMGGNTEPKSADRGEFLASTSELFSLWKIAIAKESIESPCDSAQNFGLSCSWYQGNLSRLINLNYPAVLKFYDEQGLPFYGVLKHASSEKIIVSFNGTERLLSRTWFDEFWRGSALIFWQAPKSFGGDFLTVIDKQSDSEAISWLEERLSKKQQRPSRQITVFDALLINQLGQFQQAHRIPVSESASKEVLMILANNVSSGLPIFNQSREQ